MSGLPMTTDGVSLQGDDRVCCDCGCSLDRRCDPDLHGPRGDYCTTCAAETFGDAIDGICAALETTTAFPARIAAE